MNFRGVFAAVAVLITACSSPAFAAKPSIVATDDYRVIAAHVNTNLGSFSGKVGVTAPEGQEAVAEKLSQKIAAAGYNVSNDDPGIRYSVRELYAGEADKYTPQGKDGKVSLSTGVGIAASIGLCLAFGTCSDPSYMANDVLVNLDHVNKDLTSQNPATTDPAAAGSAAAVKKPVLVVEYEVCRVGRSCATSVAASYNPELTLDDLRLVNASEGLSRAINLKIAQ